MRQLVYEVCYTRHQVSFYLWWIGSVLKYCKVPKYYDQDCSLNLRPVMTLWQVAYHQENQRIYRELQHLFKADHSWPCAVPFSVRPSLLVAFIFNWLVLHWRHASAIICNYGGLRERIYGKSSLKIISTYRWTSYSGHVSDTSGKIKENIKQLLSK